MRRPGFTLVETLIVIVFISLSIWGGRWLYDWYVRSQRADEAKAFVEKLVAAQWRYFKIHGRFLPLADTQKEAYFLRLLTELEVEPPPSPFFFRVVVLAGANDPPSQEEMIFEESSLPPFPAPKGPGSSSPWFYIVAFVDQDGDGEFSRIEASSWSGAVVEHQRTE